ncbi:MAG TPA: toll/interleukin-1 receptor domain-containing protein [Acetobacteraceae bacterium]|nr:toll/interleukin-1 receptor domain-containing protein [Acetobacteraceae bacterium]
MSTTAPAFEYAFFISRRGTVAAEAQEVADVLRSEGFRVLVQDYDAARGENFPLFIHDALTKTRHLLVLHSADHDTTHWTRQEFANFLAAPDARAAERRIFVLRCDSANPRRLLAGVVCGDLHDVPDPAERRRIILAVARGEAPAARPSPRSFGGSMKLENRRFTGRDDRLAAMHAALSAEDDSGALRATALTRAALTTRRSRSGNRSPAMPELCASGRSKRSNMLSGPGWRGRRT